MRKILGYIQIWIFIILGFWLITFKFQSATAYNDVYWIAGLLYVVLGLALFSLGRKYRWFEEVGNKIEPEGGSISRFTIPLIFLLGVFVFYRSQKDLLNLDSIPAFVLLIIPLASVFGYISYLIRSSIRPSQFRGTLYNRLLVPILYLGSFFLLFSILVSGNKNMASEINEMRTFELIDNDCSSDYISVKTPDGIRNLYNPKQSNSKSCEMATKVKARLRMNDLGIDYFDEFEYVE